MTTIETLEDIKSEIEKIINNFDYRNNAIGEMEDLVIETIENAIEEVELENKTKDMKEVLNIVRENHVLPF